MRFWYFDDSIYTLSEFHNFSWDINVYHMGLSQEYNMITYKNSSDIRYEAQ